MSDPAPPPGDTKDWTWVLEKPCPDCGFDASTVDDVAARTRAAVAELHRAVLAPGAAERPSPEVWSALEYACHARDVCIVFGARLAHMRGTVDPEFPDWNQDETALASRYWAQDPVTVAAELAAEGERLADALASLQPDELDRPGRRSNGSVFTVDSITRYLLHDLEHHVHDVRG